MLRVVAALCGAILIVSCFAGCSKRQPASGRPSESGASTGGSSAAPSQDAGRGLSGSGAYEVAEVANPGVLEVAAVFSGSPVPTQAEVPVNVNAEFCAHKVMTEEVIVDAESLGLQNVVVRLEGISRGAREVPESVTVSNKDCAFYPHVTVAVKGTKFAIRNEDSILHTTHPYVNNRHWFNVPLPSGGSPPPARPIRQTGVVEINCDVHKWMRGYTVVHTNPYIEITDAKGNAAIDKVPPGDHTYVAWHEQLGEQRGTVTIKPGETLQLKLEFKLAQ